jgi:hypothetical protein
MAIGLRRAGLVGFVTFGIGVVGCEMRVGSGGPPPDPNSGLNGVTTACSREGPETKLAFGGGTNAFAWVWDGDHYVVAYADPAVGGGDIFVATMGIDGTVIHAPVDVQATPAASDLPSIVKTSGGYLVGWQEGTAGQAVLVHALDANAAPTGGGTNVASTNSSQSRPVLARAPGGQVACTWMDSFDGKGGAQVAMIDPGSLTVTGPQRIAEADIDGWPWIAGDDQALAVAWSDEASSNYGVNFASLDHSLALADQCTFKGDGTNNQLLPRMARTSYGFFAAWEDVNNNENHIRSSLVDSTGKVLGGGIVEEANTGDADWPNIAWDGTATAIVYYQWRAGRPQIYLTFLDATGARVKASKDLQVSNGGNGWSKFPDVQFTGTDFGVLYVDTRDGAPALWLQRVTCSGG